MNVRLWVHSAVATTVSGAAGAVVLMVADPLTFNLRAGLGRLGTVAGIMALIALANFLKQHPVPDLPGADKGGANG